MQTHSGHNTQTADGVFYEPQDAYIDVFDLILNDGTRFPLKRFMVELSYFEDLYSFSVSGYVMLRDAVGLIETHRITGKEQVELRFGKSRNKESVKIKLRLYKIGTRTPTGDMTSEFYKLYFCSEELLLSQQMKISKSYKNKPISEIVTSVLTDKMKVSSSQIGIIEPTVGVYDFIVPNLRPFEAISWLSTYARPNKSNLVGADMLLYQNDDGFHFRSLSSLMKQKPVRTYKYQQNNLVNGQTEELSSVLSYEVVKSSDALNEITQGMYANRVITVDPLRRRYETYDFDYAEYTFEEPPMNGEGLPTGRLNRDGVIGNQAYESCLRVVYGTSQQDEVGEIKTKDGSVTKDMFESAVLTHRSAQLSLANHTVLKMMIPGDTIVTVGDTIQLNIRSNIPDDFRPMDEVLSGKYLVTAVRHILQSQGIFQTVLEIAKNGTIAKMG